MIQDFFELPIKVKRKGLQDISHLVQSEVERRRFCNGLLTLWCIHTGASLIVQANADEGITNDIELFLETLVPKLPEVYTHRPDDPDNAPSHIRAMLTQTQISIPIESGELTLGKVQSLFFFEHRDRPQSRLLRAHFLGDPVS